ncbi:MAG: excinuclease ABC subunit UvrA [Alphaproteobacteria bacterium]|nr:excinuclease ABC subunit UvrA [Alphaproteobacteria bacterium]MBP7759765.1 excinuclease ABC subunit UvrA [Alphaproteobacteria bacterium]MBP7763087.1 excinuclease ABC subunit UvrA [Alphaproteobacteria bacterium]MBP7904167.1 excinuclease ABC subunit UvrA [Alphaproteobacteria bacterium]
MLKSISIRGAREHNLKNINVELPRDQLVVITGLSGSGKSSLAFDTIYAEGQRRYVESLSAYARQFLEMMQKPDVDSIEGLSPAISIEQKTTSKNPRSTVGTVTEIYDYMRLLWARVGIPYSPATGKPITSQTVSEIVDRIMALTDGTKLYILSPMVRGRKGEYRKEFKELQKKGFQRVKVDGTIYEIGDVPKLDKQIKHDISVVVDRLVIRHGKNEEAQTLKTRLADSVETALQLAEGLVIAENADNGEQNLFSEKFACPVSGFTIPEIEPRLFSFNNPHGACPACDGLGEKNEFAEELVVPDDSKSIAASAIEPWSKSFAPFYMQALEAVATYYGISMKTPWAKLDRTQKDIILFGSGKDIIPVTYTSKNDSTWKSNKPFEGVINNLRRRILETTSNLAREEMTKYQISTPCDSCEGKRLKPEALAVKIDARNIAEISVLSIEDALAWFSGLPKILNNQQNQIADKILKEISERLGFLMNVGLDYLTLSRASGTLSGGESQRIRLASQIGSGLTGVLYVLDEPSIGLHQRDNNRLLETLRRLRDLGNTVIVVEHDEDAIRAADYLVDMGPGAGIHGGEIVAEGTPENVFKSKNSVTAQYMRGEREIPVPEKRRKGKKGQFIEIKGASGNNLQNVSVKIPLGTFTCITGVSGSGKSTLTIDTLYRAASRTLMKSKEHPLPHESIMGFEYCDKVIDIDQSPIGRTPRSNPATYTGAFTPIRDWFSGLPESKARGYGPGRFSFNVKGGRCEACQGDGVIKIEMHFLPDVYVQCEGCAGKRYNRETLEVKFKGKSIADVLDMSVEEAAEFFQAIPSIRDKMETLRAVGLTYIKVGQQATTLSGGEAQRVKLAKELSKRSTGKTLYILDEPTTGLHFEDVRKLLEVLHQLVDQGNTVVVIEHNLDVIKTADFLVDIGPEGGHKGGQIIGSGTPEDLCKNKKSYTGQYLNPILTRQIKKQRTAAE